MGSGFRRGGRAALPLALALLGFGVSFGVLARKSGMGRLAPVVMSATTYAGSAQFAAASILGGGGGLAAAVVAAVLLSGRSLPMGIAVAPTFTGPTWWRFVRAQLITDESWALGNLGGSRFDLDRLLGASVVLYVAWVGGTAIGAMAGDVLGDPATFGLDAAFPALFLALLAPHLAHRRAVAAALLGAAIAVLLTPVAAAGVPIVAATFACLIGLRPPAPSREEGAARIGEDGAGRGWEGEGAG